MRASLIAALLAFLLTVPWLGKEFYSRGEPREALVAQSMLTTGNWLVGTGYGGVVPSKPPFTHWLMALSSYVCGGMNEYASRLPAALALVLFAFYYARFLSRRYGEEFAILASLILLLSAEWLRAGVSARVDTVLSVTLAAAFLSFYEASENQFKRYPILLPLLLCMATLTKGPVALLLAMGVFGLYLLLTKHKFLEIARKLSLLIAPAALLSGIWYLAGFTEAGDKFGAKFYYENIARFAGTMEDEPHRHSVFYLYGTVFLGLLPWTLLFLPILFRKLREWGWARFSLKSFDTFQMFALCATLVLIVFYSIPSSKRSVYLLPIYPFLSFWVARAVMQIDQRESRWVSWGTLLVCIVTTGLLVTLVLNGTGALSIPGLPSNLTVFSPIFFLTAGALAGLTLYLFAKFWISKQLLVLRDLVAVCYLLALMLNASVLPAFSQARSPKSFVAQIKSETEKADRIYSFGYEFYGVSFYLNRRIDTLKDSLRVGDLVLLYDKDLQGFNSKFGERFDIKVVERSSYEIEKPDGFVNLISIQDKK